MSSHEGKFSKPSGSKPGHGEEDSRLDDSRVVNVDPDEDRDLELSLEMEQIRDDEEEEEEKIDSDLEDLEHKGGARSPARRPLPAPKSVLPQEILAAADSKTSDTVKNELKPEVIDGTKKEQTAVKSAIPGSSGDSAVDSSGKPAQPVKTTKPSVSEHPVGKPSEPVPTATKDKPADKPAETTLSKDATKPIESPQAAAVAPTKEKKESTSWNPFKKKTPKPAVETTVTIAPAPVDTPTAAPTAAAMADSVATTISPTPATATGKTPVAATAPTAGKPVPSEMTATSAVKPTEPTAAPSTAQPTKPTNADTAKDTKVDNATEVKPIGGDTPVKDTTQAEKEHAEEKKTPENAAAAPKASAPTAGKATVTPTVHLESGTATATPAATVNPVHTSPEATKQPSSTVPPSTTTTTTAHTQDKPSIETKPTKATTKSPQSHTEEAKNTHFVEPSGRSFKFKRNRQAAEETGNQGGQSVTVMPKNEVTLKLQSAWRGKQARRKLRKQQYAAIAIQSIYRGNKERERSSLQMKRHREKIQAEQTRKSRLAHIRSKEKDLMLLASIPPDQYLDFERLRRENGARAIQRNYRAVLQQRSDARQSAAEGNLDDWLADDVLLGTRANTSTMDTRRYPPAFIGKTGKAALSGHSTQSGRNGRNNRNNNTIGGASSTMIGSTAHAEEKVLREQSDKLRAHMVSAMSAGLAEQKRQELFAHFKEQQNGAQEVKGPLHTTQYKPYEVEIEALALAQLQRKVKEAALNRTRQADARAAKSGFRNNNTGYGYRGASGDVNLSYDANTGIAGTGTGGAPRWGARRNYQDLMEAQTQANILLEEHLYALPHITERQSARHKTLGNVQHLLQQLQAPLSLDQAKSFIQQQKKAAAAGDKGKSDHKNQKEEPFDPHAAAWLLDEVLWSADKAPLSTINTTSVPNKNDILFVNPTVVQSAAEQHIHALHALRTSGITHSHSANNSSNTTNTTNTTSSKKHWGAVALPLPLHIVTNPANTSVFSDSAPVDGTLRNSGEWKDVRNSFNRSFDADTANNTATNATTTTTTNIGTKAANPNHSNNNSSGNNSAYSNTTPSSLSQRLLTDAKLFRPLATQWAAGSDVEDSLYWIAYATQPSNIKQHPVDPSPLIVPDADSNGDKPTTTTATPTVPAIPERTAKEYEELRRRIAVEAMCLSQRVPRVRQQVQHEQERINRLAEVYQGEMFAYLRKEHALSAAQLLGGEKAQQQHLAASRVQALARGRRARIYVAGLRAQQRVYLALQNLFHEIALSEGVPPPPLPSNNNNNSYTSGNGSGNTGNIRSSKQQMQLQAHQQGRANMFNNLLTSLAPAMQAHTNPHHNNTTTHTNYATANKQVNNNTAPSTASTRTGGSTLAGLNISNNSSGADLKHNMHNTHLSGLTTTPFTVDRITSTNTTPSQYPLQAVIPPTNKQYTAHMGPATTTTNANNAYTDPRALVSNITHKHVNIHGQTPSYFSPMVQGAQHSPSRGIEAHYKDFTNSSVSEGKSNYGESKYGDYKHSEGTYSISNSGVGIAGTPGPYSGSHAYVNSNIGGSSNSVVNRGAWSGGLPQDNKKGAAGGSNNDPRSSSPSRHTFNLLTASYSAGQQVPEESLLLSQSFTSGMNSVGGTPHSPERYTTTGSNSARGNSNRQAGASKNNTITGPFSPKATVSFSLEVPSDHNIPSGRQLQRSIDTPILSSPTRPLTITSNSNNNSSGRSHPVDTPGSAASHLSEFSFVHEDDLHPHRAYISSPGGTHRSDNSLSRSLSASFGQVSGNLPDELYEGKHDTEEFEEDVRRQSDSRGEKRTNEVKSPFSPDPRDAQSRGGLSPSLLARYGNNNTSSTAASALHSNSSDDSVEAMEIPYQKRSLSSGNLRSFRVHGTVQASKIAARATVAVQQAMLAVEGRFRSNNCTVQGFVGSAMAADVRNFDKAAALRLLQSMAMVTGVSPLIQWLQRFRYDPQQAKLTDPDYVPPVNNVGGVGVSPSTSLVMTVGEIAVQDCALLIAELTAELQLIDTSSGSANKQQSDSEREKEMMYNLIQTCVLLKLLGAAADSGRLHISELHALLEDSWVLAVPMNGTQVSLLLAQLRFALLQHATRKAHHPRKSFDALLTFSKVPLIPHPTPAGQDDGNDHLNTSSVATLFSCIFTNSAHFSAIGANTTMCVELAQAAVRLIAWKDSAEEVSVLELRNFLCSLCSFRSLQKRIQVWFRAVPGMHQTLLKEVAAQLNQQPQSNGMVNSAAFCQACDTSGLPLSHAECFMLSQLLTRRKPNSAGVSAEGGVTQAFVDVAQLQRIKVGDFLQAAL